MTLVDMRSDTVTRPTAGMRQAIAAAEVGDDVFGDDPTALRLQRRVAELLGKEEALYVPSGTMGNQVAIRCQTRPGDQVVCEAGAHIYHYEGGAPAALSGVTLTPVAAPEGLLSWDLVAAALNPDDVHAARPALVCLENSHNRAGGRILPQDQVERIGREAHARRLRVHLDGARLWNVHVATGTPLDVLAAPADTVSVCFSKGLGAPVGSVLAGDAATIAEARRVRKRLGGGMRQVGILAAACLYALDHHLGRLRTDHEHARLIAESLANPHLRVGHAVETNIVVLDVVPPAVPAEVLAHLAARQVLGVAFGAGRVRLVPNLDVDAQGVERAIEALNSFPGPAA